MRLRQLFFFFMDMGIETHEEKRAEVVDRPCFGGIEFPISNFEQGERGSAEFR